MVHVAAWWRPWYAQNRGAESHRLWIDLEHGRNLSANDEWKTSTDWSSKILNCHSTPSHLNWLESGGGSFSAWVLTLLAADGHRKSARRADTFLPLSAVQLGVFVQRPLANKTCTGSRMRGHMRDIVSGYDFSGPAHLGCNRSCICNPKPTCTQDEPSVLKD